MRTTVFSAVVFLAICMMISACAAPLQDPTIVRRPISVTVRCLSGSAVVVIESEPTGKGALAFTIRPDLCVAGAI